MDEFPDMQVGEVILPVLRAYQEDVRDRARVTASMCPKPVRVVIQASTGAGKSVIALDLNIRCHQKGKRGLFIVSGRVLVNQFEGHLQRANVPYGVIMAGRGTNTSAPIQIASKETLTARCIRKQVQELPPADLVMIDECHESMAKEWRQLLERYNDSTVIGLTATPAFGNGKGLGSFYNGLEMAVSTSQLVAEGWLVPCKVFAPAKPNLKGVKVDSSGDYNREQLAERMDRPKITGDVLTHWKKYANGRKTVIFGCTIQHAKHLCEEFNSAGIVFRHIDQSTGDEEREDIFGLIQDGKVMGFTNVSVARRGLDLPCLECACVVRPTRSLVLWLQMIGRIRRIWLGKTDCVIIDHSGACDRLCMPDQEIAWSLDNGKKVNDWLEAEKDAGKIPKSMICPKCDCMFTGPRCPNCGYMLKAKPTQTKEIEYADGILVERTATADGPSLEEMQRAWNKCVAVVVNRGRTLGAAVHMFADQFEKRPWEIVGLQYVPPAGELWKKPAEDVFPGFKNVKVRA